MAKKPRDKLWVVVEVFRGLPAKVQAYWDQESALKREKAIRRKINLDYDDTGVFPLKLPAN